VPREGNQFQHRRNKADGQVAEHQKIRRYANFFCGINLNVLKLRKGVAMETLIKFIAEYVREHEAEYEEWKKEQEEK
jgi:hypothetical protein